MPGSHPSFISFTLAALACAIVPAVASASPGEPKPAHGAHLAKTAPSCAKAPVEIVAGAETATLTLTKCDGAALPAAVDRLSVVARPGTAVKPTASMDELAKVKGPEIAPGIRRFDARIVERLGLVVDHFAKEGETERVVVVSGVRPRNSGSFHSTGRALDFRIDGVKNDALVAFCKTLSDTGCGYYPNDAFVHMDVRDPGAGHVAWVDTNRQDGVMGALAKAAPAIESVKTDKGAEPAKAPAAETPKTAMAAEPLKVAPAVAMAKPEPSKSESSKSESSKPEPSTAAAPVAVAMSVPLSMAVPVADKTPSDVKPAPEAKAASAPEEAKTMKTEKLPALPSDEAAPAKAHHHRHKTRKARLEHKTI